MQEDENNLTFLARETLFRKKNFYVNTSDERASLATGVRGSGRKGVDWAKPERKRERERREMRCLCSLRGKERGGIGEGMQRGREQGEGEREKKACREGKRR
ncbi:hypothetical protein AAC387_Pa02g1431 [Persea americana]